MTNLELKRELTDYEAKALLRKLSIAYKLDLKLWFWEKNILINNLLNYIDQKDYKLNKETIGFTIVWLIKVNKTKDNINEDKIDIIFKNRKYIVYLEN